jgi:DNA-binding CsgD family transcriptional regulator
MAVRVEQGPLERDAELARIDNLIDDLAGGQGRVLTLEGPAGIGKTTLVRVARERAEKHGLMVLGARASELERDLAYGVPRQWLSPVLMGASKRERQRLLNGAAALAGPVLEDAAATIASQGAMHGLLWLIAALAEAVPLLLILDDAHWADESSMRFVNYLAPRLEGMPVSLVIAGRPPGGDPAGELLARLLADPDADGLKPSPLSEAGAAALIEQALGEPPGRRFLTECHQATRGNPFLLASLARELRTQGVTPGDEHLGRLKLIGPQDLARSLLARLSGDARGLARAIALLDDSADVAVAAELAGLAPDAAAAAADELRRAGLVEDRLPLRFVHSIVTAAVIAGFSASERAAGHEHAAALLSAHGQSDERIAAHLLECEPKGSAETVATLQSAAASARRRGAPEVAVRLLERALVEPPAGPARGEVLEALGRAEHDLDLPAAAEHLWEASQVGEDPLLRARALLQTTWAIGTRAGPSPQMRPALEEALRVSRKADPELARLLEASLVTACWMGVIDSKGLEERIEQLSRLEGRTAGECAVLAVIARVEMDRGAPAEVVADIAARAARRPGTMQELNANSSWLLHTTIALRTCERLDEAERLLDEALAFAREQGLATGFAIASANLSGIRRRRGDLRGAETHARAAMESGGARGWYRVGATTNLVEALTDQGRLEEAWEAIAEAGLTGEIPTFRPFTPILIARGALAFADGDLERAQADLGDGLERILQHTNSSATGLDARLMLAQTAHLRGDSEQALRRAEEALRLARAWGAPGGIGSALRVHGELTGGDTGRAELCEAVALLERSPFVLDRARALLGLGAALRRAGTRADARTPLRAAFDAADAIGAAPVAERARRELAATGIRVRRSAGDQLTPSEQRIAEMAAAGQSNPQIAQALFVTVKTVETHLAAAYRKLDISSRRELPPALAKTAAASPA